MDRGALILAALLSCAGAAAPAHELWLMPSSFEPARGQAVAVELRVGAGWPGESIPRQPQQVLRLGLLDAAGELALPGAGAGATAAVARPRAPGASWLVYRSDQLALTLDAPLFERYLREEGLEHVVHAREQSGESARPGRELYARCAKTLLRVDGDVGGYDMPAGLPLELMLLNDPRTLERRAALLMRVLHQGQPLRGVLVKALPRDATHASVQARSAADGTVALRLGAPGVWLINAVHMQPARRGVDADWESLWSSLTLSVGGGVGSN
jgi:uncharacterized GH25 family protein